MGGVLVWIQDIKVNSFSQHRVANTMRCLYPCIITAAGRRSLVDYIFAVRAFSINYFYID
jgi:hypothetical protein